MISSVTGREIRGTELGTSYWTENLVSPVRFSDALSNVLRYLALDHESDNAASMSLVVEVGPHSALQKPILQIFNSSIALHSANYLSVLSRNTNSAISRWMRIICRCVFRNHSLRIDGIQGVSAGRGWSLTIRPGAHWKCTESRTSAPMAFIS